MNDNLLVMEIFRFKFVERRLVSEFSVFLICAIFLHLHKIFSVIYIRSDKMIQKRYMFYKLLSTAPLSKESETLFIWLGRLHLTQYLQL